MKKSQLKQIITEVLNEEYQHDVITAYNLLLTQLNSLIHNADSYVVGRGVKNTNKVSAEYEKILRELYIKIRDDKDKLIPNIKNNSNPRWERGNRDGLD